MKIWLCYGSFGGGHLATARAVGEALRKQPGEKEILYVNLADFLPAWGKNWMERWYDKVIRGKRTGYMLQFWLSRFFIFRFVQSALVWFFARRRARETYERDKPDTIVMFYFFTDAIRWILKAVMPRVSFDVVVTDPFTASPLWFSRAPGIRYVVFSERMRQAALDFGVDQSLVRVASFPLRSDFYTQPPSPPVRGDLSRILLGGAGVGIDKLAPMLQELVKVFSSEVIIDVVCGTNVELVRRLEDWVMVRSLKNISVHGFAENMAELMRGADVVVGKAGPTFVFEALELGKPLVLIDYIWGQEKGTVEYVVAEKFGWYEPDVRKAAALVRRVLKERRGASVFAHAPQERRLSGAAEVAGLILAPDSKVG